jgi:hypothetical protein
VVYLKKNKNMNKVKLESEFYLKMIDKNKPFSLSRFGDGEVLCINNKEYFKGRKYGDWILYCGDRLKQIFFNNYDYYHCYLDCTFWERGPHKGNDFIKFIDTNVKNFTFYYGEIWQNLSFAGRIRDLTKCINKYNPVFIGGKHLNNLKYIDGITNMNLIEVDDLNAYNQYDYIYTEIMKYYKEGRRMFCFSCSVVGKILIDDLYPILGKEVFMIDFGSVWDPYCGILSRSGMVKYGFEKYQPFTKYKLI